ncbi:uncharacterized protein LOC142076758, partial [Calonectris borealis]|uniref:uncharacterized protein LOC142076758 n=1 Tax=Calonectris borealis TaxID=1323832 RepID=UPI003F4AFCFA
RRNRRPSGWQLSPAAGKKEPASPAEEGSSFVVHSRPGCQHGPQGGGQPSDQSCRRGREERRRKKRLNCQSLLAAPRARAAVRVSPGPSRPCLPSCASWALPASLLAPSLSHALVRFFFFFVSSPVPLLFSLFLCPAPSPFFFFHSLSLSCRHHCVAFPSLCPDLHPSFFPQQFLWPVPLHSFPLRACTCRAVSLPSSLSFSFHLFLYPFVLLTITVFFHCVSHCPSPSSCLSLTLSDPLCCSLPLFFFFVLHLSAGLLIPLFLSLTPCASHGLCLSLSCYYSCLLLCLAFCPVVSCYIPLSHSLPIFIFLSVLLTIPDFFLHPHHAAALIFLFLPCSPLLFLSLLVCLCCFFLHLCADPCTFFFLLSLCPASSHYLFCLSLSVPCPLPSFLTVSSCPASSPFFPCSLPQYFFFLCSSLPLPIIVGFFLQCCSTLCPFFLSLSFCHAPCVYFLIPPSLSCSPSLFFHLPSLCPAPCPCFSFRLFCLPILFSFLVPSPCPASCPPPILCPSPCLSPGFSALFPLCFFCSLSLYPPPCHCFFSLHFCPAAQCSFFLLLSCLLLPIVGFFPSISVLLPVSYFWLPFTLSCLPVPFFSLCITLSCSLSLSFSDNQCPAPCPSFSPLSPILLAVFLFSLSILLLQCFFLHLCPAPCPLFPLTLPLSCFVSPFFLPLFLCPAACPVASCYTSLFSQLSLFPFSPPLSCSLALFSLPLSLSSSPLLVFFPLLALFVQI